MSKVDDKEIELKKKMFGSVRKIPCTGGHFVDIKELYKPLEWERGVMRSFCEGCGYTLEITEEAALKMAEKAGVKLPSSPESYYFHTKSCGLCDGDDNTIELEEIPSC